MYALNLSHLYQHHWYLLASHKVKEYVQVKDEKDLVRDPNSKAILNTNIEALHAYKKRKQTYTDQYPPRTYTRHRGIVVSTTSATLSYTFE